MIKNGSKKQSGCLTSEYKCGVTHCSKRFRNSARARPSRKPFCCLIGSLSYVYFCSSSWSSFSCCLTCCRLSATAVNLQGKKMKQNKNNTLFCWVPKFIFLLNQTRDAQKNELVSSPVLQLVQTCVGWSSNTGALLPLLPLRQLL